MRCALISPMSNLIREAMPGLQAALLANMADAVTYESMGNAPVTVQAILSFEDSGANTPTSGTAELRVTDTPAPPRDGDELTYASTAYRVCQVQTDAFGWCRMTLRKLRNP